MIEPMKKVKKDIQSDRPQVQSDLIKRTESFDVDLEGWGP